MSVVFLHDYMKVLFIIELILGSIGIIKRLSNKCKQNCLLQFLTASAIMSEQSSEN